jgi:hypothetical protein
MLNLDHYREQRLNGQRDMTYVRAREMMDVQFHLGSLDEKNGGPNFTSSNGLWLGCCFVFGHSGQGIGLVSTKHGRQSTKGYAQDSDVSVDRCARYELDGDARHGTRFYPGSAAVRV